MIKSRANITRQTERGMGDVGIGGVFDVYPVNKSLPIQVISSGGGVFVDDVSVS